MKPEKQFCTTPEQSDKLIELGLSEETADLFVTMRGKKIVNISLKQGKDTYPAWTLSKLVEITKHISHAHPEIWYDVDFFEEIFNEVCYGLADGSCYEYWSDEKRKRESCDATNRWSKYAEAIKHKLPKIFCLKTPEGQELIDFYVEEGDFINHRDDRLGRIYRATAELLKELADIKKKPKTMLSWARNIEGCYLVSIWAVGENGVGCFQYETGVGITKISAMWNLIKNLHRFYHLNLLKYIVKREYNGNGLEGYDKRHFKIKTIREDYHIICERHSFLGIFHYWDDGVNDFGTKYKFDAAWRAREYISKRAREFHFDFVIHSK